MKIFLRPLLGFAAAAILIAASGCGGEDPTGKLSLHVRFPQNWENLLNISMLDASAGTAYIDTIRAIVDCGEASPPFWDSPGSDSSLSLGTLDLKGGCDLTVQAITGGVVIMEKTQQAVSIPAGATSSHDVQLSISGGFDYAGSLTWPRMYHSAVAIGNDEVLVLGGSLGTKSIERVIYSNQGTTTAAFGCSLNDYRTRQKALYDPISGRIFVFLGGTGTLDNEYEAIDVANEQCAPHFLYNTRTEFFPAIYGQQIYLLGGYDENSNWIINTTKIDINLLSEGIAPDMGIMNEKKDVQCSASVDNLACLGGMIAINYTDEVETFDLQLEVDKGLINLSQPKKDFSVTKLSDGRIFIAGGIGNSGKLQDVEIFDLNKNISNSFLGVLKKPRIFHTATELLDGKILITGGGVTVDIARSAEIFDPVTHTSRELPWKMRVPRSGHTATLLSDGRVLIIGGNPTDTSMESVNPSAP